MFSKGSARSTSLATVTPSLVTCGAPKFFVDHHVAAGGAHGDGDGLRDLRRRRA
jgi:hypothetical protein